MKKRKVMTFTLGWRQGFCEKGLPTSTNDDVEELSFLVREPGVHAHQDALATPCFWNQRSHTGEQHTAGSSWTPASSAPPRSAGSGPRSGPSGGPLQADETHIFVTPERQVNE